MENREEKLNRDAIDGNNEARERELLAIRELLADRLRSRLADKLAERLSPTYRRRRHP